MSTRSNRGMVKETKLHEALGERYLSYALSTITSRSLPDVRDGLKPVQRRILFAMKESGNTSDKPYRKSASAVGYVMMKYHPHGNDPIYEAMVRMAQDFSLRYPLVDGQGNFGSIDGDNPAAMRYTEARLTPAAAALLAGIDEHAVDFQPTYNNEGEEPLVLPSSFPNLLANGTTGIAVGMATNIPPHNVGEICDALLLLLKKPNAGMDEVVALMPGPDFPTGGILVEPPETILRTYETGRGSFRLRARYFVEEQKGGTYNIVVTEIPYQVQKARLIERIADLIVEKKIPILVDVRDESAHDIRLVLMPKSRSVDPQILMETLFRMTDLEVRFSLNMNVLDLGRIPRVMSLKEVLQSFLTHRVEVLCRRTRHRLDQIAHRLEVLLGYQIAYLNLDEVIQLIRESDEPKQEMQARWQLTDVQAEAILNMRLRALRRLEEIEIVKEIETLSAEKTSLEGLLADEGAQKNAIGVELKGLKKTFGTHPLLGPRRTTFEVAPQIEDVPLEALIEREPVTIVCSAKGWVRALKGHETDTTDLKYKEGDEPRFILKAETIDKFMIFASNGRFYTLGVDRLPGGRGHGESLHMLVDLGPEDEIITTFVLKNDSAPELLLASSDGRGFRISARDVVAQTKNGKQVMTMAPGAKAAHCLFVTGTSVATLGSNRKMLVFGVDEIPTMTRGRGVTLQKYRDGALADIQIFIPAEGLKWSNGPRERTETDLRAWLGRRGQVGKLPPLGFSKTNRFRG